MKWARLRGQGITHERGAVRQLKVCSDNKVAFVLKFDGPVWADGVACRTRDRRGIAGLGVLPRSPIFQSYHRRRPCACPRDPGKIRTAGRAHDAAKLFSRVVTCCRSESEVATQVSGADTPVPEAAAGPSLSALLKLLILLRESPPAPGSDNRIYSGAVGLPS